MTLFLRYSNRLLSQFSRNNRKLLTQSKLNYSSNTKNTGDIIVSRKKKYIYVGCVLASMAGFAYYTKREQEYSKYSRIFHSVHINFINNTDFICSNDATTWKGNKTNWHRWQMDINRSEGWRTIKWWFQGQMVHDLLRFHPLPRLV